MSEKHFLMFDRKWMANYGSEKRWKGAFSFITGNPCKDPVPFLTADKPWESLSTGYGTMIYDRGIYRLWYEAWDKNYKHDYDGRLCYAESTDGINWRKPVLGLIEFDGNKDNNIVFDGIMSNGIGFHGHCIFIDPNSPPFARYRMIFGGGAMKYTERDKFALNLMSFAYSSDGTNWKWGVPESRSWLQPPFVPFSSDTQSVVYWDETRSAYIGYFREWQDNSVRLIARSETNDFGKWPHPRTILSPDEHDMPGEDFYTNAASRYISGSDSGVFLFISMFDHLSDTLYVQLATSRDGICFKRSDRTPFLKNDSDSDRGGVYICPGIMQNGYECIMAYHGVEYCHEDAYPDKIGYSGNFRMIRFKRDRLAGLYSDRDFEFNLKAFEYEGGPFSIRINVLTGADGFIKAGLMEKGQDMNKFEGELKYLQDFSPDDCIPISGDGTGLELVWKGGNVAGGKRRLLELRIFMSNATVYSITVQQE
ncbi:MAG: hypothetical protein FIA99_04090 [Ruminiclostridium sp.]|nr:hypothetical protein [Ruminiclostridium sp.]